MTKVMWRLLPLMALMFLVNQLDRVNVSFAALTMNRDLGLSTLDYAWGAGIFFIAYFVFEVPSNLIMERVGARRWIARIMISWGLVTCATMLVKSSVGFLALRFLLGVAEAGFVPGLLLYITWWFPPRYRARATAVFFFCAPVGNAVAGLLSVPLLAMDGFAGLHGWQWMFFAEGVPALILGLYVVRGLPDRPRHARWLAPEERDWLEQQVDGTPAHSGVMSQLAAILNRRAALLSAIYLTRNMAMYGVSLFLPLILSGAGLSNGQVGLAAAIPFAFAAVGTVIWAAHSDRNNERHWHTITAMALAAAGLILAAQMGASVWSLAALSVAALGLYAQAVCFWSLPPLMLSSTAAAAGIAAINATGNLGGFLGPYLVGASARGADFSIGLYLMAACAALSAGLSYLLMRLKWDVKI
ncbi:MAG TPA: MFS transporter [Rhizomicrobium sp.]|jgi:ACS family tartrate transporter-like MFS transporter